MSKISEGIREQLISMKDEKNRLFVAKLIPNIPFERILWIKTPPLRTLAKELSKTADISTYFEDLPHYYLEENHLHGFLIEQIHDFWVCLQLTESFLPYIDNWATCDMFSPKIFKKHPDEVYSKIKGWIISKNIYTVRFAIQLLIGSYLDEEFKKEMLELVARIQSDEYYIQMVQAWYFATALAKQKEPTLALLKKQVLSPRIQNKSIQKARESKRIDEGLKNELLSYKIKIS